MKQVKLFGKFRGRTLIIMIVILVVAMGLRAYDLMRVPPSLYWEEVALGYDAWSLAETGRDYHGNFLPLVAVESFGDFKPSGYFYALVPFVKIFGVRDFVIKIPSVIAGIAIVFLVGLVLRAFFPKLEKKWMVVAMAITALNPALIQVSRVGFETNLATAFFLAAVVLMKRAITGKKWQLFLGEILLLASFYTYHAMRVIAPLVGIYLLFWWGWQKRQEKKRVGVDLVVVIVIAAVAIFPFLLQLTDNKVTNRFQETTIFTDLEVIKASNQCREVAGNSWSSRIFCHRWLFFTSLVAKNFTAHLDLNYLFLTGDENRRHSVGLFGVFYPFEVVFLFLGLVWASKYWRENKGTLGFFGFWLVVGLLPASMTLATPHLLRTLSVIPLLIIVMSLGLAELKSILKTKRWRQVMAGGVILFYVGAVGIYQWYYFNYYRAEFSDWWQYGYREALASLEQLQREYPQLDVYVTRDLGRASMYYFWYRQIEPTVVQEVTARERKDQGELTTFGLEKVTFGGGLSPRREQLVMITPQEQAEIAKQSEIIVKEEIKNPAGEVVLVVGKVVGDGE
jgi:4-amino-4-deoxy-L-arabinose transferase-like glycosyltransferase